MAIEGPLRELSLSDVFQLLDLSRKTGVLTVTTDRREQPAIVRFERGAVVGAQLRDSSTRMGHLLLRSGKVTESDVERARAEQERRPGRPLGAMMVELGMVAEADVRRQLRFQIEETVFEIIQWNEGYFRFEEASGFEDGGVSVRVPTESLLMEAARRIDEWSTLEPKIAHMGVVPAITGEVGDGGTLDLHPKEWEVLAEIDGTRSLRQVATDLGRSEFEVAKIVYGLVSTGVVDIMEETSAAPAGAQGDVSLFEGLAAAHAALREGEPARALRLLGELVRTGEVRPEAYVLMARAQARLERWAEAVSSLERVIEMDPLSADAHYHLGFASVRMGGFQRADAAWGTYLRLPEASGARRRVVERARAAMSTLRDLLDEEGE